MIYNETRYNSHWNTKKLSDLGIFARGKSKHRPRDDERLYEGGGYPLIQTGEVKAANLYITKHEQEYGKFGLAQSKMWDAGTLCITIAANIAETAILSYPMCFPDSVVGFRAYPEESSELFMHYVFTYIRNSIQNSVSGSIQDNINIDYLSQLDFKIPDKAYQDKVVCILGAIDQKIDTNNRTSEELEAMAKTIYDYWFTQFDFPDADGNSYRSSGGAMEWNEQLKSSIPKRWKVRPLIDVLDLLKDGTHNPPKRHPEGIPLLTGTMFGNTVLNYKGVTYIAESDYLSIHSNYTPQKNDVIMTKIGSVGAVNILREDDIPLAIHCNSALIRFKKEIPVSYAFFMLKGSVFQAFLKKEISKTVQEFVSLERLSRISICVPPDDIISRFAEIADGILDKMILLEEENRELTKLRDWLLPMLMNGQATVE